jgi:hypothetical protein
VTAWRSFRTAPSHVEGPETSCFSSLPVGLPLVWLDLARA